MPVAAFVRMRTLPPADLGRRLRALGALVRCRRCLYDDNSFQVIREGTGNAMSIDKSLRRKNMLQRSRNVLTRGERILQLQNEERWQEGRSPFGLPKVRVLKIKGKAKKAKEEKAEEGAEEAAPAAEAAPAKKEAGKK